MQNVKIKEIAVYHPEKVVSNETYISHFKEQGRDISHFLEFMGRKERFIIDNEDENGLTMGIEAAKRVLEQAGLTAEDLDMIVFTTQVPETSVPSNAVRLHYELKAPSKTIVFDTNFNCAGMLATVDQVSHYMRSNKQIKRTLIVGSDHLSLVSNPQVEITYACFGDAASAVILEATDEDTGFIDALYYTNTESHRNIMYPTEGLSRGLQETGDVRFAKWLPFDGGIVLPETFVMLSDLMERNGIEKETVKCCFSQFALSNVLKIQEHFKFEDEQIIFVGDQYGYTGSSSPFLALYEGVRQGRIQRGDYVLFWTIGTGFQLVAMLLKY